MIDNFAARLKKLRKENGLTQEELGWRLEVSRSAVANWEKGMRCPSPVTMRQIAILFNVSSDYLCGRSESRRNTVISPVSQIDLSGLNADGMRLAAEFCEFLLTKEQYRAQKK